MSQVVSNTWISTGNDYIIDGLWGRLGVQENFGDTLVSGATNGLAVKDAGDKVYLYAGSVNGGIHLRVYDKNTDNWGDRWDWISKPGSGYLGSQAIGVLAISEDGKYLAVGQGNPSNGKVVASKSQGLQIGRINDDGSIQWLPVSETAYAALQGKNIRSLVWNGANLVATSWSNPPGIGSLITATTSDEGIVSAAANPGDNSYLSRGGDFIVYTTHSTRQDGRPISAIAIAGRDETFSTLTGANYQSLIEDLAFSYNAVNRVVVHKQLVDGALIAFIGGYRAKGKEASYISVISRLLIDPATKELLDYKIYETLKGDIGDNQAYNSTSYGNFSLELDPHDPTANSVFVGGNGFWNATLQAPTTGGGLVRVDFSGDKAIIADTLYGPKIDQTNNTLIEPFSPGQPHADSRTIVFYDSATGPRLIQSDDGGIWELQLAKTTQGVIPASDAWWQSLTTKGLNTLEMNVGAWNAATNSIAAAYQDNAASLGYFGDDHATNFWLADGTIALFDDGANQGEYTGYLGHYNYIENGTLAALTYNEEAYITGRNDAPFYFRRTDKETSIPWMWNQVEQSAQELYKRATKREDIFNTPVQSNAYQQGVALAGFANIYEQVNPPNKTLLPSLTFRPLLENDIDSSFFYATALDYQGTSGTYLNQSLYVAGYIPDKGNIIFGRTANNDPNSFHLEAISANTLPYTIVDIAHASTTTGDIVYWLQGGRSIAFGDFNRSAATEQTLNIRDTNGVLASYSLKGIVGDNDPYGYQTLVYVPAKGARAPRLVIGGLNGPYEIELNDQGMPQKSNLEWNRMPWQGLPADSSPGSYIRSMDYDPHDDLLFAATQGQGGFIYSFSGELGERPQSSELLHISDITLAQRSKAALDKRSNLQNSTIAIQLNSELQAKDTTTDIEIILHDAAEWRKWMQLVSPYNLEDVKNETAKQYLNILDPVGLAYRGGREENGNIILPFTFPAGVSLYNLIVNQIQFPYPTDTVSLDFTVRTIDGENSKTASLALVAESTNTRAVFSGATLAGEGDSFDNGAFPQDLVTNLISQFIPSEYRPLASTVGYLYTITPSTIEAGLSLPTTSKVNETRTTFPVYTYPILRGGNSLNSAPNPARWLFASKVATDPDEVPLKLEKMITYDPTTNSGSRFYDIDGNGYADYLSVSANASQSEFLKDVALTFGSVVIQPTFTAVDSRQVLLEDGVESDQGYAFNIRVKASVDLQKRPSATSSIAYIILNADETLNNFSNELFKERAKSLITVLGESVDLSEIPESSNFNSEILINTGQRVIFFEVEGGSLDQLTGLEDPRLIWFETNVLPELDGRTLALSNQNHTALTVNITDGVQNLDALVADLQNQKPILDFTAFATDQTITGTLTYGREAALNSSLGWYVISSTDGAITAANGDYLLPGHASYIQEALRADNLVDPLTGIQINDRETGSKDFSIQGGRILAPYARVSNGETYFAFAPANSDGLEHFYSLGTNKIGFEDLKGGGDRDFQDLVQMFDFNIDLLA